VETGAFLISFGMEYQVLNEKVVFNDHYQMKKAQLRYDTFNGGTIETTRLAFERGDSVAIVLYEKDSRCIVLTKQFRYPATKHDIGWITEIPAGSLEKGESPLSCVLRETKEETGFTIAKAQPIATFYVSPGGCTERCHLFYAEVTHSDQTQKGGGKASENEDILIMRMPVEELRNYLATSCQDGKTFVGLQWFLMNKIIS
jgi:ADP-ribose pyrophosphatase